MAKLQQVECIPWNSPPEKTIATWPYDSGKRMQSRELGCVDIHSLHPTLQAFLYQFHVCCKLSLLGPICKRPWLHFHSSTNFGPMRAIQACTSSSLPI